jgi:preprotein translocase subunit YajC
MAIIFLYLALLAGAFFVLIVRPQRRQLAARRALIASLEVGDEVITAGGIYGTVRELTDTTLLVEVAPGVTLTLAREAVSGRPPTPPEPAEIDLADADDETEAHPAADADEETDGAVDPRTEDGTALGRPETTVDRSAERDLGEDR